MKRILSMSFFSVLILCFAVSSMVFSEKMPASGQEVIYELEQKHHNLEIRADQLLVKIQELTNNEVIRKRNGLKSRLLDLETEFDDPAFHECLTEAVWVARVSGLDVERIRGLYDISKKIIARAEFDPDDLKQKQALFKEKYGIDLRKDYRKELNIKISLTYLRSLLEAEPAKALNNFMSYTSALRKYQEAEQYATDADKVMLEGEQQLVRDISGAVPLLGDALDLYGVVSGEDPLTGEKLSATQRGLDLLLMAGPDILEQMFKKNPAAAKNLKKLSSRIEGADDEALKRLAAKLGKNPSEIKSLNKKINRAYGQSLDELGEEAVQRLAKSADGRKSSAVWKTAQKAGKEKVERIQKIIKDKVEGEDLLTAYQDLRMDKRGLTELQKGEYAALRKKLKEVEDRLFSQVDPNGKFKLGKVDKDAIKDMKKGFRQTSELPDDMKKIITTAEKKIKSNVKLNAYKHGVDPKNLDLEELVDFDNLDITVFSATNKPPAVDKIGFDRDITFQIKIPKRKVKVRNKKTGKIDEIIIPATKVDIPAEMVEKYYQKNLYKNLNPGKKIPPWGGKGGLREFGENMDHAVTDGFAKDAYRVGTDVVEFFKDPTLLKKANVEDFASTVTYKSTEWFDRAAKSFDAGGAGKAMAEIAEGMRQASKQYENYMEKILPYLRMHEYVHVSIELRKSMKVFDKVRKGVYSVPEAEAALKAMGLSKEKAVKDLGLYFESVLKMAKKK